MTEPGKPITRRRILRAPGRSGWSSSTTPTGRASTFYARAPRPGAALPDPSPVSPEQLDAPFAGSDFSLSDLGLEFLHWPGQCQLASELRKGQSCYRLESTNPRGSGIVRVNASIDKESLGPLYAEAYDSEGKKPVKVFSLDSMKKDAHGRYDVKEMEIDNKKLNSQTDLIFDIPKGQ